MSNGAGAQHGAGAHLVSGHPPKMPTPRRPDGMRGDRRNGAGAHLVSGHPPKVPAPRLPLDDRRVSRARLPRVRHVGSRVKRPDDPRVLTGRGRYVDDMVLLRMVHVAFVRSAHAHAHLARVDVDAARRTPDVVGVLDGPAEIGRAHV